MLMGGAAGFAGSGSLCICIYCIGMSYSSEEQANPKQFACTQTRGQIELLHMCRVSIDSSMSTGVSRSEVHASTSY